MGGMLRSDWVVGVVGMVSGWVEGVVGDWVDVWFAWFGFAKW